MNVSSVALFSFLIALFFYVGVAGHEPAPTFPLPEAVQAAVQPPPAPVVPAHIDMPDPLHGIYATAWTAGSTTGLAHILSLFGGSDLNAVVIDIKDASGRLSYEPLDPDLAATGVGTKRIANLAAVINTFHARGIYVIGRVSVFQDPFYASHHSDDTLHDTRTGLPWTDYKGLAWLRPDSTAVQDYIMRIARDAYAQGFDEINLDYVRFPSDGPLEYIDEGGIDADKATVMAHFFTAMHAKFAQVGIPMSADVFGLTMSVDTGLGIGQKADLIAPSVDVLAPMIYPSHFGDGVYGIAVPAADPYDTIHHALADGIAKLAAVGIDKGHLRPWLQDFDLLGVDYTPQMVQAQIHAAHDLGINSWIFWDPANRYTGAVFTSSAQ